jgi:hypothetical protein
VAKPEERKEWARRLQSEDPGLEVVHPHAAGIDVGNGAHYVAVVRVLIEEWTDKILPNRNPGGAFEIAKLAKQLKNYGKTLSVGLQEK